MNKSLKKPRNKFEYSIYDQLRRAKVKFEYEGEKFAYILACHYLTDWKLQTPFGKIYIESKGYLRPADKRKLIAVKRQHPEIDLRILFYPFRSLTREKQYTQWAIKNGFRYAIGKIPKEWLLGL